MGKVITVANQKGGVGKTTISTNLAVEAAKAGLKTILVDTDTQASSMAFAACRNENRPQFRVFAITEPIVHREAGAISSDYDLVIIDAGGRDSTVFRSALTAPGLVLIPVTPSPFDVWATRDVFGMFHEIKPVMGPAYEARILFNMVFPGSQVSKDALEKLEEVANGIPVLKTRIRHREGWKTSAGEGLGVSEHRAGSDGSAADLGELWRELGMEKST